MPYELVQGLDQVLPKTDIRPHEEIERREVLGRERRKGAVPGGEVHPVALRVQLEIGKHRRIGVEPRHLGLKGFGAGDAHQAPAAAEVQDARLRGHAALVEIVQQHKTRGPDLVPMERGGRRVVL
jgi:hypothetical protein